MESETIQIDVASAKQRDVKVTGIHLELRPFGMAMLALLNMLTRD